MDVSVILRLDVFKRSTDVLLLGPASDVSFLVPDPLHMAVLACEQIVDQRNVGNAFIGLAESPATPEILQHQIKIPVQTVVRNNRGRTHKPTPLNRIEGK